MFDPTPLVGGGCVVGLMALSISFVLSSSRGQRRRVKESDRDKRRCERRCDILVRLCRTNGIDIPASFWEEPDDETVDEE